MVPGLKFGANLLGAVSTSGGVYVKREPPLKQCESSSLDRCAAAADLRTDRRLRCRRGHPVRLGLACSLSLLLASYWPLRSILHADLLPVCLPCCAARLLPLLNLRPHRCCSCALCGSVRGCACAAGGRTAAGAVSGHASAGRGVRVQRCTSCFSCGTGTATEAEIRLLLGMAVARPHAAGYPPCLCRARAGLLAVAVSSAPSSTSKSARAPPQAHTQRSSRARGESAAMPAPGSA